MSREKSDSPRGGLKVQTLLISAASAVVAATVVPLVWERGTVYATAMTPIIIALVSEALRRPVERVSAVAPKVTAVRRSRAQRFEGDKVRGRPRAPVGVREPDPHDFRPVPDLGVDEPVGVSPDDPFGLREPQRRRSRSWWRAGLITGALAFVIGAGVLTASELAIFGGSVSGERGRTTIFGGSTHHRSSSQDDKHPQDKSTPKPQENATPQATATPTPQATPTPTPTTTATPTATPPPAATAAPQTAPEASPTP